jgi:Leucine-rich repeat (LRR) protein
MNQIDSFECGKPHKALKYLLLTNNVFSEIPQDVTNLENLKHLALDKNKITDVDVEIFREYRNLDIQITLSENPLKIKPNQKYLTKEKFDIKEIPKENFETMGGVETEKNKFQEKEKKDRADRKKTIKKNVTFANLSASPTKEGQGKPEDDKKSSKKEFVFAEFHYKQVQNLFEFMINDKIEEECNKHSKELSELAGQDKLRAIKGKQIRFKAVKEFLINELIGRKNEAVIGKFADLDLKVDIKEAYEEYKREKQVNQGVENNNSEQTSNIKLSAIDLNDHKVDPEYRKNYLIKVAKNSNNLIFLKAISINLLIIRSKNWFFKNQNLSEFSEQF